MAIKRTPQVPPVERVETSYKQLSQAATNLNAASDEMGKAISLLDASLKKLNLGVSAWITLSSNDDGSGHWWTRDLGYTKVGDKWGIALRKAAGDYSFPEDESEEIWVFHQGPRWMRTEAAGKIPDLLEELLKQTEDTTKKVNDKTCLVYELAAAMEKVASEAQPAGEGTDALPA